MPAIIHSPSDESGSKSTFGNDNDPGHFGEQGSNFGIQFPRGLMLRPHRMNGIEDLPLSRKSQDSYPYLPAELQAVLELRPALRQSFVLRLLVGFSRDECPMSCIGYVPTSICSAADWLPDCASPRDRKPLAYLAGREPAMRMSTSLLALCCQSGLVATLATPISARSRSIASRSLRMSPLLIARFTSARIASHIRA